MPGEPVPDDARRASCCERAAAGAAGGSGARRSQALRAGREEDRELIRRLGCGSPSWSAAWTWTAPTRARPARRSGSGRERPARPGSSPSGSAARTASAAGSPATREKACSETRIRVRRRPRSRRRSAGPARASLDGAEAADPRWAQVIDIEILRKSAECPAARAGVRRLRDGHVRGAAAGLPPGLRVLRAGPERGRGAAVVLRERAGGAVRAAHRHAARRGRLRGLGRQGRRPGERAARRRPGSTRRWPPRWPPRTCWPPTRPR